MAPNQKENSQASKRKFHQNSESSVSIKKSSNKSRHENDTAILSPDRKENSQTSNRKIRQNSKSQSELSVPMKTSSNKSRDENDIVILSPDPKENSESSNRKTHQNSKSQSQLSVPIKNSSNKRKSEDGRQTESKVVSMYRHIDITQGLTINVDPKTKELVSKPSKRVIDIMENCGGFSITEQIKNGIFVKVCDFLMEVPKLSRPNKKPKLDKKPR